MKKNKQSRHTAALPLWLRICVCACLLLFTVGAIAQATHVHDDLLLHSSSKQHHSTQNDCQLCTAMHALLIAKTHIAPLPVAFTRCFAVHTSEIARSFLWRFQLASRPPPAAGLDLSSQVAAAV
ncbi:MAG: hypothetical protein JSS87_14485 [Acidobacteria bacterium]|nr:hypothetical protein [Acidobacteriota bacterium]